GVVGTSAPFFAVVVVVGAAVVVVAAPGAVVAAPAAVVVVVGAVVVVVVAPLASGGRVPVTGRKSSWAVWPTTWSAVRGFLTPASATTMSPPWVVISGSATPSASTRFRMMFSAVDK